MPLLTIKLKKKSFDWHGQLYNHSERQLTMLLVALSTVLLRLTRDCLCETTVDF